MKKEDRINTEDGVVNPMSCVICMHRTYVHLGCFYEIHFN